jgi:hypothetical protein
MSELALMLSTSLASSILGSLPTMKMEKQIHSSFNDYFTI